MRKQRRYHHGDLRASLIEAVFARLASGPPDRAVETEELAAVLWASVHGTADLVMSQLIPTGANPIGERVVAQVARLLD
jgi:hypothetical protein